MKLPVVDSYKVTHDQTYPPEVMERAQKEYQMTHGQAPVESKKDEAPQKNLEPLQQFFAYEHLPPHLQGVSRLFGELADKLANSLPRNPERTVALRKLLEAKDCAVRAVLYKG